MCQRGPAGSVTRSVNSRPSSSYRQRQHPALGVDGEPPYRNTLPRSNECGNVPERVIRASHPLVSGPRRATRARRPQGRAARSLKKWPGSGGTDGAGGEAVVVWIWGAGTPASRRAWRLAAHRSRSQRPGADGVGPSDKRRGGAERAGDGLVDVGADLVAVRGDGGAEAGDDVGRVGAQALHGGDGRGGHPGHGAPPARVHAGEHAGHRIVQHDRHAVRGQDGEHHAGRGGDQRVGPAARSPAPHGTADGVVERERATPPVGRADDADPGAVHLAGEDEIRQAERRRQPPAGAGSPARSRGRRRRSGSGSASRRARTTPRRSGR